MNNTYTLIAEHECELLDGELTLEQFAQACRQQADWVHQQVQAEVLHAASGQEPQSWRFSSTTVVRARRIAHLQNAFDADSQLAALTVDLMEEVDRLRRLLA